MKTVKVIKDYEDKTFNRIVRKGESIQVNNERSKTLIRAGYVVEEKEYTSFYKGDDVNGVNTDIK